MWDKLKVDAQSFSSLSLNPLQRSEKDKSEHDTVLSRAMLRYYGSEDAPKWLEPARDASQSSTSRVQKPARTAAQPAAAASVGRTSLDFLNKDRRAPVQRENPITALTQGMPQPLPRQGSKKGRLGEKLRGANW